MNKNIIYTIIQNPIVSHSHLSEWGTSKIHPWSHLAMVGSLDGPETMVAGARLLYVLLSTIRSKVRDRAKRSNLFPFSLFFRSLISSFAYSVPFSDHILCASSCLPILDIQPIPQLTVWLQFTPAVDGSKTATKPFAQYRILPPGSVFRKAFKGNQCVFNRNDHHSVVWHSGNLRL